MASLVVQTSFLGDVILTTPLIAELARRAPVDVVTTPEGAAVLANNPDIRSVITYDKRGPDRGVRGFTRIVSRLRDAGSFGRRVGTPPPGERGEYETAYLAQGSVRSAALAVAARIGKRIGFRTSAGRALYTARVEYQADRHHAERLWWLSMSQCADPPHAEQITPRLYPGADDVRVVDALLAANGIGAQTRFVAIAPGSAWGTKRWPFYPELAVRLANEHRVVIVGGTGDAALGAAIIAQLRLGRGINAAGQLGVLASAELIRRAAALVTNDSAPQHLASAVNTATLAIYGPTVASFGFGPLAARSATVGQDSLACRPCHTHGPQRCPLGHWRCMRELSSDHVFDLLARTLS